MTKRFTIVGIGEILWDLFPDGAHFGGAPANFACSAAELCGGAADVFVVGGVGRDELGRKAIELLRGHSVDTSCVTTCVQPTGKVLVKLDGAGVPTFEIATDTAWDNVDWSEPLQQLAERADVVCFGTLAQRSPKTRRTIRRFLNRTSPKCLRVLDINLRPPFWNAELIKESYELANVMKLNDSELWILADIAQWPDEERMLHGLAELDFKVVAVTRGVNGATLVNPSGERSDVVGETVKVVDTVGAGDAFTAALAIGMLNDRPLNEVNAWANRVAAFVCSQPGATPHFPAALRFG